MMRGSIVWRMGAGALPALALIWAAVTAAQAGDQLGEGESPAGKAPTTEQATVPNFVLKDLEGKDVSLADLRESGPVVLNFWATWCKPCLRELPHLEALRKEYEPAGLTVVAITIDDTRSMPKVKPYIDTHGYGFKVLLDSNQRVLRQLQGTGAPYVVLLSADGRRLYTHSGYRDGDEKELAKAVAEAMGTEERGDAGGDTEKDGATTPPAPQPSEGGGQSAAGEDR
jgi:cytochrome c biogenesis protein CcmG, thiol:disulfide interchange protein DsbE